MKHRIHILIAGLALTLLPGLRAADDAPFTVDVWGTVDGLPQGSVISIRQSRDGYLWLGTLNGLVRFDGNTFTHFNVNNTPGLPGNVIAFLFEDQQTNLWVGTDNGGLCRIHAGTVQNFDLADAGGKVVFADENTNGEIWFSTGTGKFFRVRKGQLDPHPPTFSAGRYYQIFHLRVPGKNGVVWSLQNGRVQKFNSETIEKDFGSSPWPNAPVTALYKSPDGQFIQIPFDANVTAACEDPEGNLVVGTRGMGVYWLDATGSWHHIATDKGLSQGLVLSLCFDREGNLWAGTDGDGLERIRKNVFTTPPGFAPGAAQSIAEDAAGGMWVAYNGRGLTYARTNGSQDYRIGSKGNAWSVLVDRQQRVWAGTRDEGLFLLTNGNFQPVTSAEITPPIHALFQSRDGRIWVGGQNGLGSYDGTIWKNYTPRDGLPADAVRALAEDAQGQLWIGTKGNGLFILRNKQIFATNAPVKDISSLLVDRDNTVWAGTAGHGLGRLAEGRWTRYTAADGLAGDDIGYLIDDQLGNLWIGSYEGLMRVDQNSLARFAAGAIKKISGRIFLTRECSIGAQPAAIQTSDQKLWFPTIEGVVALNPAALKLNTNPPPVIIESVLVDGVGRKNNPLSASGPTAITLAPEKEQLEIGFASLNFSAPKHAAAGVRFRYRLEDRNHEAPDKSWTDIGGERVAHFPKLPAGEYTFHVQACNEDGVWNLAGATLAVTVRPPFWQTRSFMITAALALLGALAGIIYLISTARLKRQLRAARQKELIEKERARIARDLHDQLGANLTQVTLLGEMAEMDKDLPGEIEQHAKQICATARETTRALDEIVWAVNPANDTLEGLVNYAGKFAQDYFTLAGIRYRAELPTQLPATPIPPEVRHNVFLAFKEAVNNVVKHAQATEAHVSLQLAPGQFSLSVTDNGQGVGDLSAKSLRNGLKNMRKRLAEVQGEFDLAPGPTGGTVVRLTVPLIKK